MMRIEIKRYKSSGFALLAVVFILVVLATATGYLMNMTLMQGGTAGLTAVTAKAQLHANSGLEWALNTLHAPQLTDPATRQSYIQRLATTCSQPLKSDPCLGPSTTGVAPWHTLTTIDSTMTVQINCSVYINPNSAVGTPPPNSPTNTGLYLFTVYSYATQGTPNTANFVARCKSIQVPIVVDNIASGQGIVVN